MKRLNKYLPFALPFLIFFLALFLRTYRLSDFVAYHQDQVRDLVFIKEHFQNKNFIFLGPKASVGDFFLPPFWYYLMASVYPFSQSPVAPALLVAILNSLSVLLVYFFVNDFINRKTAVYSSLLMAVSPFLIEYSRFAWNPNPIPFFEMAALYFLYCYLFKNKPNFFYPAVIMANLVFQLHYQGFMLVAAVYIFPIIKKDWKRLIFSVFIFILLLSPFFFNEITKGYPNITQIFAFLSKTTAGRSYGLANSIKAFANDYPEFLSRTVFFGYRPLGILFSILSYYILINNFFKYKNQKLITPLSALNLIFFILLLTLFAYRQWIVPYYLLVIAAPLIIITAISFRKYQIFFVLLIALNLFFSPAFSGTDSSLAFFKKSLEIIKSKSVPKNCIKYEIEDPDLKFAPKAIEYLADIDNYSLPTGNNCFKKLVFCQKHLCDRIKGNIKVKSDLLGLSLIEK